MENPATWDKQMRLVNDIFSEYLESIKKGTIGPSFGIFLKMKLVDQGFLIVEQELVDGEATLVCAECYTPLRFSSSGGGFCNTCGFSPSMQDTCIRKVPKQR